MPERTAVGLRYGPQLAAWSVGYVVFSYAAVPSVVTRTFGVGFAAVGLLMSAALASFVAVQPISGRLVDDRRTLPALLAIVVVHAALALSLDFAPTYRSLLALRGVWGLAGGLTVTVGATHISRVFEGTAATVQQGVFGGMLTFGGAVAFVVTPRVVAATGWVGVHAVGGLAAVPAIVALWHDRDLAEASTPPALGDECSKPAGASSRSSRLSPARNVVVLLAAACYVATLSGYITLSTFVTAYFADLGVEAPLNTLALLAASIARAIGGFAVVRPQIDDGHLIAGTTGIGAAGLFALTVGDGAVLVTLPVVVLAALSLPFGAIVNAAASAVPRDATAVAVVVAAGNLAALVLPAVTGWIRDVTGAYDSAFALLALLNLGAAVAGAAIARRE